MILYTQKNGDIWLIQRPDEYGNPIPSLTHHPIPPKTGALFECGLPDTLVIHYTAGETAGGAISTWEDPAVKASAHFIVDRNGAVIQCVPINRIAWHAGRSTWRAWTSEMRTGLNAYSIGIELVNPGRLEVAQIAGPGDHSQLKTWYGKLWTHGAVYKDGAWWAEYTEAQIAAVEVLVLALKQLLSEALDVTLQEVVGHSDIAPGRKLDPGPAFPMTKIQVAGEKPKSGPQILELPEESTTAFTAPEGPVPQIGNLPAAWDRFVIAMSHRLQLDRLCGWLTRVHRKSNTKREPLNS